MSSVHRQLPGVDCTKHKQKKQSVKGTHTYTHTDINHLAQLNMKNPFRSVVIYAVSGFRNRSSSFVAVLVVLWADFLLFSFFFANIFPFFSVCDLLKGRQQPTAH